VIAAIYVRAQTKHVADEQKSVARQIERSRAYALRKGWTVNDPYGTSAAVIRIGVYMTKRKPLSSVTRGTRRP
jgi:hypothetical protein